MTRERALNREAGQTPSVDDAAVDRRLVERTRELNLIQNLGRAAAAARSPDDLFAAVLAAFEREHELDLALVAHALEGRRRVTVFENRPYSDDCLGWIAGQAAGVLGWSGGTIPAPDRRRFDRFDPGRGPRNRPADDGLTVLPVLRGEQMVAVLLVVPSRRGGEAPLRLLYSATNHLSVHLDRILATREAEADRFRAMLDSMPQAVLLTDAVGHVRQINRAAATLFTEFGLAPDGTPAPGSSGLGLAGCIDRVRRTGAPLIDGEIRANGDRLLSVSVSPLRAGPGESEQWVVVLADVTESRRLQRQLAQSEKMSSLGQMISGVAHELNNPLTSILGYAQLMQRGLPDEALPRRIEVLGREAERCQRIVANLLSFARAREPEKRALSLNEIAESVLALMGYQLRADGIEITTELDAGLHSCYGDPHELQQVLINLLTNARHAIRQSGSGGRILIRTRGRDSTVVLEVQDDGPGIAEALREKIFDPFYTTKPEGQGTGLGLSLVYGIVTGHGGTIAALPGSPHGAVLRVQLPARRRGEQEPQGPPSRRGAGETGRGRVLVVDDEEAVARMLVEALGEEGHVVKMATDGRQALDLLAREPFDLVLADLKMPGLDGEQLYGEIRHRTPGPGPVVLLTSGDTVGADAEAVASRTGLELLRKPFDIDSLLRCVRAHLASPTGTESR